LRKQRSDESSCKPKQNSNKSFVDVKLSDSGKESEESKRQNKTPQRERTGGNMLIVDRDYGNNDRRPTFGKAERTESDQSVGKNDSGPSVEKPGSKPSVGKPSSRPSNIPASSHSRNKPQIVDEQAETIKPNNVILSNSSQTPPNPEIRNASPSPLQTPFNLKDEAIQISPQKEETKGAQLREIGTQFTFEDPFSEELKDVPINLAVIPLKTSENEEEEKLIFNDEQGDGQFKSLSEADDKFKDSDKTTENYKNSFDSRKTSQKRFQSKDIEESKSPPKHPDPFQIDTKNLQESSSTNISLQNTDRKKQYHDIDNLALFTLKDWKDSVIFDWYSSATKLQRYNFVAHVIQRENEESGNPVDVLNFDELSYVMKLINSRNYSIKKSVNERHNEDGTKVSDYIKFDAFNVVELFESLKRTIIFVYGLFGLDKYILYRVYGIYHQDDDKKFRTTENATKLCIRCKLGYEMISKWTNLINQITERNLISNSIWNVIYETKSK
jgi:hypothetical protein